MTATSSGDIQIIGRSPGITVAAGSFFQNTCVVQVLTDVIRLLEPGKRSEAYQPSNSILSPLLDARERLSIKEPSFKQSRIVEAYVLDPYILIRRENESVSLYIGDTMEQKITSRAHIEVRKNIAFEAPNCTDGHFDSCHLVGRFACSTTRQAHSGSQRRTEKIGPVRTRWSNWKMFLTPIEEHSGLYCSRPRESCRYGIVSDLRE